MGLNRDGTKQLGAQLWIHRKGNSALFYSKVSSFGFYLLLSYIPDSLASPPRLPSSAESVRRLRQWRLLSVPRTGLSSGPSATSRSPTRWPCSSRLLGWLGRTSSLAPAGGSLSPLLRLRKVRSGSVLPPRRPGISTSEVPGPLCSTTCSQGMWGSWLETGVDCRILIKFGVSIFIHQINPWICF